MKKFVLILGLCLTLGANTRADDDIVVNHKLNIDEILDICGPKISDEYVPDLVLKQKYAEGAICLEKHIKRLAKDVFNEENYQYFCDYLTQNSSLYLKMMLLLNEKSNGVDNLPGTFEQMQTYSQLYNFLTKILETVINYRMQQKM
jgi:hypothetical protein